MLLILFPAGSSPAEELSLQELAVTLGLENHRPGDSGGLEPRDLWLKGLRGYLTEHEQATIKDGGARFRKNLVLDYLNCSPANHGTRPQDQPEAPDQEEKAAKATLSMTYSKAVMFFHMLENEIGRETFLLGLQNLSQRKNPEAAGWDDLLVAMNQASGRDLSPFFSQWLERTEIPVLGIGNLALEDKEGRVVLSFRLVQQQKDPFRLQVPLEITTLLGKTTEIIEASEKETEVEIALDASPSLMVIDPEYALLRKPVPDEIPPTWARFAGAADKLAILPGEEKAEIFQPLLEMLQAMDCPTLGAEAATDAEIAGKSVIFLGTDTPLVRSIFADSGHADRGVTVEVRENPLGPGQTAVLVSAASAEEMAAAVPEIDRDETFTFLHLSDGRVEKKSTAPSEPGQIYVLDTPPKGMIISEILDFEKIIDLLAARKVVYVGESHNRNEDHLLQLRVIRALHARNPEIAIGMEMFNRPSQPILDDYVQGKIDEWEFLKKSHYFEKWRFDYRYYRDIINFARRHQIPVVALNLEKEIVSKVFKDGGIEALAEEEKQEIPEERDLSLPGYRSRIGQAFGMHGAHGNQQGDLNNFLQAQALWDETMAESAADYLQANPGSRLVVVAGMGHTDKTNGIPPRVSRRLPGIEQAVVLNSQSREIDPGVADFVLFSPPAPLPPAPLIGVMLEGTEAGLKVAGLAEEGKAREAGIRQDDIILSVDNEPVRELEDLKIPMFFKDKGDTVHLHLKRKGFWGDRIIRVEITL